ncbi:MAG: hypothetical protein AAF191_16215 [Verrucomicrobiota bacterium]
MKLASSLPFHGLFPAIFLLGVLLWLPQEVDAQADASYRSVWAKLFPDTLPKPEEMDGQTPIFRDFYQAAGKQKVGEALTEWETFQRRHPKVSGGFEDAVHGSLWKWAAQELTRCRHMKAGETAKAGEVEQSLKDLAAREFS